MRIGIQTWGSTGDIRPFVALAHGLHAAGHTVHLVVTDIDNRDYAGFAKEGLAVTQVATPVVGSSKELDRIGLACINAQNPIDQAKIITNELFNPAIGEMYQAALALCRENELIVRHFFHHPAKAAADKLQVPEISVMLAPNTIPSAHICPDGFPHLGKLGNRLGWWLARQVLNKLFLPEINRLRKNEGVRPVRGLVDDVWSSQLLNLVAVSRAVCQPPPDWQETYKVCGFLNLPVGAQRPEIAADLDHFLAGSPPVFITFGSLTPKRPAALMETVALFSEAVRIAGCRAVIQVHDEQIGQLPAHPEVYYTGTVDHAAVLPCCAMAVHHAGAGTTQSALMAGLPSVAVPHVADQFFWGRELHRLGAAPEMLPVKELTAPALAGRIKAAFKSPAMRERAQDLSLAMHLEDGVATAVEMIQAVCC